MLYDLAFTVNWNDLKAKKLQRRLPNNEQENRKCIKCQFNVNDEVMLERNTLQRKMNPLRDGPFTITKVYTNGTVRITERYRVRTRQHQTNLSLSDFRRSCVGGINSGRYLGRRRVTERYATCIFVTGKIRSFSK